MKLTGGTLAAAAGKMLLGFTVAFPLIWMVITSLKSRPEAVTWPPGLVPARWMWENYAQVFQAGAFGRWFLNSLVVSLLVAASNVVIGAPAAFAFSRVRFPGRDVLFFITLATLMMPGEVTLLPNFVILSRLGWIDTYMALVVPFMVSGFSIFLMKQFFETIPRALEESAIIEGCGPLGILWYIFLPLARPAAAVTAFFAFMRTWNSYFYPLVVTRSQEMRTVTVGLSLFRQEYGTDWPLLMGAATVIAVPAILAFIIVQRYLTDALTWSGITG